MTNHPERLQRLLRPQSVAVIGGSWAEEVARQLRQSGFAGPVWPVHPKKTTVAGYPAYADLAELPGAPDAAFVAVNRDLAIETMARLNAMGAGGAICFASGFRENGDEARHQALLRASGDMPFLGPNCYGMLNYLDGATVWPDQHGGLPVERGVAIISQSGNIACNLTMQARGLPLAYMFAVGNQAKLGFAGLIDALSHDPRISAIGLVMEAVDDGPGFAAACLAAHQRGVPVVVMKLGASQAGAAAAMTHTASLAGRDTAASAFFRRLGVGRVQSLPALVETLKLLHHFGPLPGGRLLSMSCSGGEAAMMADMITRYPELSFPAFAPAAAARLRETLSDLVTIANPLDYHTFIWNDQPRLTATYSAAMQAGFDLSMLIIDWPRPDRCSGASWEPCVAAMAAAARASGGRAALVSTLPEGMPESIGRQAAAQGLLTLCGAAEALEAIAVARAMGAAQPDLPARLPPEPRAARVLSEAQSKAALAAHGLRLPRHATARDAAEAVAQAAVVGFPLVLKGQGHAHKTEVGAVALNLRDTAAVAHAAQEMMARGAAPDGFLLEEMITDTVAELIIGVTRDPPYGLALTLGAGGIMAEMLRDTQTVMLPATDAQIAAALDALRLNVVLRGWRGRPAADRVAAVRAIRAIADYALTNADRLLELDVNPLILTAQDAIAVDALIRVGEPA